MIVGRLQKVNRIEVRKPKGAQCGRPEPNR